MDAMFSSCGLQTLPTEFAWSPPCLRALTAIQRDFEIDDEKLKRIAARFEEELYEGLSKHGENLTMEATWVHGLPKGTETGSFLTVDLGGTNIRVCWITLRGRGCQPEIVQKLSHIPEVVKTGEAHQLWGFVADSIDHFVRERGLHCTASSPLALGFTFSYPVRQDSLTNGRLKTWTKGFDIKGVEGEDVVSQLDKALRAKDLHIDVVALINDTTGALIASSYMDAETVIGAIFGTGSNAAYMENVGSIPKLKTPLPPDTPMAINCEYGAFDNSHRVLPRTKFDQMIDRDSPRPGEQTFEKMSAGLYLGEIFRLIICDFHDHGLLFKTQNVSRLARPYTIDTAFLSALESDTLPNLVGKFESISGVEATLGEVQLLRRLAEVVTTRGARLSACGIAAICKKKGIREGHVAVDGSVANKHPTFKSRWAKALAAILDWQSDRERDPIRMVGAKDGSGIGAAVIAAMHLRH
ncbi:hypothetical protein JX266_010302 [Neoarthrinium moseri]|nr:hypothetical protein JX266_010302 [Neoarthrinium moseri]